MVGTGDSGLRLTLGACFVAAAFAACGGESQSRDGDGNGDGKTGGSSTGGRGGSSAATSGSSAGGSSAGGSSAGGSSAGVSPSGGSSGARGGSSGAGPIEPPGPSFCGGKPCDPPLACCMATGECFDPLRDVSACATPEPDDDPQGRKACASSAQCAAGEFCMLDGQLCLGTGHCQPIDNCGECGGGDPSAPDNPCRFCGCDGNTYPNVQTACRAGVSAAPGTQGTGCGETGMEGGAGSSSLPPRTYTACGQDAHCPTGSFCCTLNARCYVEADRDICVPPPPGTRIACKTTENCGDNEYCQGEGCTAPGGCVYSGSGPGDCGVTLEPVCGCDGVSYTSAACADQEGVRVSHEGECGD
jgi:hypothetical protein